ncbi:MAG: phytoene desaturase family protein [Candidatus Zixiibacteriota bacterium]
MPKSEKIVIIGAGLGGISAAISLATAGYNVSIYEKNSHIGGKLNVKEIDGFKFDLGPSIMILPHIFAKLFEMAGKNMSNYISIRQIEPQWRNFFKDGTIVDLWGDFKNMEKELSRFDDDEVDGFYEFLDYSRRLWRFAVDNYFKKGADSIREVTEGHNMTEIIKKTDYFNIMRHSVEKHIKNPYLRDIMSFFIKYVGSSPYNAPALLNLLPYSQLGYGEWYVDGGMFGISEGFQKLMKELNIEIHLNSEVKQIVSDSDEVNGIILANNNYVEADIIVSNMEVIPAYEKLLGEDKHFMKKYHHRWEPSASGLVIHIGLDREYPQLGHHNFFFAENLYRHMDDIHNKKIMPNDPTIYLVAPTRTDKTIAPEGHEIIKMLPHIPAIQDPPFPMEEYDQLKERCYDKVERMGLENIRDHIVVEDILTPHDLEKMYYSDHGSIYGVIADKHRNKGLRAPKRSEKYDNLYFVGGSVNPGSGMPMVLYSGQMIRDKIIEDFE